MNKLSRTPPVAVRKRLRKEAAFHCAFTGCQRPYLTYHHFDPPWEKEKHHRPEGMIALCREHHDAADGGAFTNAQLHEMKEAAKGQVVQGSILWRRETAVFHLGGGRFYAVNVVLMVR